METELSVRDVLTKSYVAASESDSVLGAVELMREERTGAVLVVRGSEAVGIMTEWDVLGIIEDREDPAEVTIESVMTNHVLTIGPDRSLTDAADMMARDNIRNLVVEDEEGVVGVLTQRDVIAAAGSFTGATAVTNADDVGMTPDPSMEDPAVRPNGGEEYVGQSVCETCGSLAEALWEVNGQLVCADCRAV